MKQQRTIKQLEKKKRYSYHNDDALFDFYYNPGNEISMIHVITKDLNLMYSRTKFDKVFNKDLNKITEEDIILNIEHGNKD